MLERGLLPAFSTEAVAQLQHIDAPATAAPVCQPGGAPIQDLTGRLWASIDNDAPRHLDQRSVADVLPNDAARVRVAVADGDALVTRGSAIGADGRQNTTSVYTAARVRPMPPDGRSTDLTSRTPGAVHVAMRVECVVAPDGVVARSAICRAAARSTAKRASHSIVAWRDGAVASEKSLQRLSVNEALLRHPGASVCLYKTEQCGQWRLH